MRERTMSIKSSSAMDQLTRYTVKYNQIETEVAGESKRFRMATEAVLVRAKR
jgi:hypothetical protein